MSGPVSAYLARIARAGYEQVAHPIGPAFYHPRGMAVIMSYGDDERGPLIVTSVSYEKHPPSDQDMEEVKRLFIGPGREIEDGTNFGINPNVRHLFTRKAKDGPIGIPGPGSHVPAPQEGGA